MTDDAAVVVAIVALRLALPLLIPRFPLAIVAALVLDAVDQTVLQQLTTVDTSQAGPYQGYDKALDIYYLTIAYLSTLLNWTSPLRLSTRGWLLVAAAIWIFVKLPQEYWIHVAQLDFTDAVRAHPTLAAALAVVAAAALLVAWFLARSRLPAPDWSFRLAADLPPISVDEARRRAARERRLLTLQLAEKIAANAAVSSWYARRPGSGIEGGVRRFAVLFVFNVAFVLVASRIVGGETLPLGHGLFFAYLIAIVVWLYDSYRPVYDVRFSSG